MLTEAGRRGRLQGGELSCGGLEGGEGGDEGVELGSGGLGGGEGGGEGGVLGYGGSESATSVCIYSICIYIHIFPMGLGFLSVWTAALTLFG